jgi:hypothetical protein
MSVCPHGTPRLLLERIFVKFHFFLFFFRKFFNKNQVSFNPDKNNGYITWRPMYIYDNISGWILLKMRNFGDKVIQKIKTHTSHSVIFCLKSCRISDNVKRFGTVRQAIDDNIIRRMDFACWTIKVTDTHSEYAIIIAYSLQQWLRERVWILPYAYIFCLVECETCWCIK